MVSETNRNDPAFLAVHARISVPDDRLALLGAGIAIAAMTGAALSKYEYGPGEIAARFTPPSSR